MSKAQQYSMWLGLETEAQRLPKKSIEYAYPNSSNAEKYAGGRGCYLVYPDSSKRSSPVVYGRKELAIKFFDSIGLEVDKRRSFNRDDHKEFFEV